MVMQVGGCLASAVAFLVGSHPCVASIASMVANLSTIRMPTQGEQTAASARIEALTDKTAFRLI